MRILVLRGGALGDFVVTLPALGLLRQRWPMARIELAGNVSAARVAVGRRYLDVAYSQHEARWSRLGSTGLLRDDPFSGWLAEFSLVVNFWPDPDGRIAADFAALGFSTDRVPRFLSHPSQPARSPASAHYCDALLPLGLVAESFAPRIFPSDADRAEARRLLPDSTDPYIAWHPGSGSPRKNWPIERWHEVMRARFASQGFRLVVIIGEAEMHLESVGTFRSRLPAETLILLDTPPHHLAAVFERCALFLGHDSGPAHVAAAVGCPSVLLFGPTEPRIWAPPHAHVRVIQRGSDILGISVADVLAALSRLP